MGYRLVVVNGPLLSVNALSNSVRQLVDDVERLRANAAGALDRGLVTSLIEDLARKHGLQIVGDISKRKSYTPPASGYMTEVQNKTTWASVFQLVSPGGGKITLSLERDERGVEIKNCPNCGKAVIGKKPAVAHNIIPQQTWKQIVEASIGECLQNIANGNLTRQNVKSFSSLSGQVSGKPLDDKFDLNQEENKRIVKKLVAPGLINSAYAAQDNVGKQCLECEKIQSNATLVQRMTLIKEKKLQPQIESGQINPATFVGAQFLDIAERLKMADIAASVQTRSEITELLSRVTTAQIGRFLLGIEKCLVDEYESNGTTSPLVFLLLDHWDEFVWSFRSVAMTMCGASYKGNLGIKEVVL